MNVVPYVLLLLVVACLVLIAWGIRDYRNWVAIGKGGLPHTLRGWLTMTRLRLKKRETTSVGLYDPLIGGADDVVWLKDLPARKGPRPRTAVYPIPHRQLDQTPPVEMRRFQDQMFDDYVEQRSQFVCYQVSNYEHHNNELFVRKDQIVSPVGQVTRGEVAHVHESDGSMHMIFGPSDARTVIEKGWGERHPLSGVYPGLPVTYLMIYAPRDPEEVALVQQLVRAAIQNLCLCEIPPPRLSYKPRVL